MKRRELRKLRKALVHELALERDASTESVCIRACEVVAQRLQRQIELRFDDLGDRGLSGLWAVTENGVHVIIVTTTRSWIHRLHILMHELAHMLCGHAPAELSREEGRNLFYPDISSEMLTLIAGRTAPSQSDECEAEHVAGTLMRELLDWAQHQHAELSPPSSDEVATRVWFSLGYSPSHGGSAVDA